MTPNATPTTPSARPYRRRILWWTALILLTGAAAVFLNGTCPYKHTGGNAIQAPLAKKVPLGARRCVQQEEDGETVVACRYFYQDGTLRGESAYKNGQPHGSFKVYYYNGQLRQEHGYRDGLRVGSYKRYYPEGGLAQKYDYVPNTTRKVAQYFYPGGQMLGREELVNNRFDGPSVFYNQKGDIISELIAKENMFFDEGRPVNGTRRFTYPNGQTLLSEEYRRGRMHGTRALYRADGALIWQYRFRNGLAEGIATEHYQDGSIRAKKYYRNHKLYKEEEFDPAGNPIFSGEYMEPEAPLPDEFSGIQSSDFAR